ncbi:DUF4173 domain-containing protein [Mesorhizobium retamae]|uniref:DUF4173 domain-containing protein n=1 Tax=Mesorhizobium retamae TaxID=2912854 RepID=A0ABS9QNJ8_9HYPH|nr:DUF4173 domain-containing protein [Mesorhizobium sp. IRAMC:0171]MCG7509028.1 DUF4173 domain-containing protein [Mesorhizobium sp. IRAMC:0171]
MTSLHASLTPKAIAALLLVASADFLLFGQPDGIALPLFCGLIVVALVATAARGAARVRRVALVLAALLPMVEAVSPLSMTVALFGLAAFALSLSGRLQAGLAGMTKQVGALLLGAPLRLPRDMMRARKAAKRVRLSARSGTIAVWTLSVALGAVFLALFGAANPIIDRWLALLDVWLLLDLLSIGRIVFWLVVAALVWALLRPRLPRLPRWLRRKAGAGTTDGKSAVTHGSAGEAEDAGAPTLRDVIFSEGAVLRALVVFNALFAVQTVLDASYLWGGVALPEGLTYAGYAHRGAYPLIVTALLAAGFVLVTLRPGSALSANRLVRALVYVWIAQNVVLVVSSILRLDLYVGIYSLTYWRVAAFIWMGLVGAGLVLIMARIALHRSNEWLLGANLATLGAVLYACCFINFATIIANYNVMHNREITGEGYALDQEYLRSLGPAAIPAMDLFLERTPGMEGRMVMEREIAKQDFLARQQNWRAWGFRNWRLARYLDKHPVPVLVPAP